MMEINRILPGAQRDFSRAIDPMNSSLNNIERALGGMNNSQDMNSLNRNINNLSGAVRGTSGPGNPTNGLNSSVNRMEGQLSSLLTTLNSSIAQLSQTISGSSNAGGGHASPPSGGGHDPITSGGNVPPRSSSPPPSGGGGLSGLAAMGSHGGGMLKGLGVLSIFNEVKDALSKSGEMENKFSTPNAEIMLRMGTDLTGSLDFLRTVALDNQKDAAKWQKGLGTGYKLNMTELNEGISKAFDMGIRSPEFVKAMGENIAAAKKIIPDVDLTGLDVFRQMADTFSRGNSAQEMQDRMKQMTVVMKETELQFGISGAVQTEYQNMYAKQIKATSKNANDLAVKFNKVNKAAVIMDRAGIDKQELTDLTQFANTSLTKVSGEQMQQYQLMAENYNKETGSNMNFMQLRQMGQAGGADVQAQILATAKKGELKDILTQAGYSPDEIRNPNSVVGSDKYEKALALAQEKYNENGDQLKVMIGANIKMIDKNGKELPSDMEAAVTAGKQYDAKITNPYVGTEASKDNGAAQLQKSLDQFNEIMKTNVYVNTAEQIKNWFENILYSNKLFSDLNKVLGDLTGITLPELGSLLMGLAVGMMALKTVFGGLSGIVSGVVGWGARLLGIGRAGAGAAEAGAVAARAAGGVGAAEARAVAGVAEGAGVGVAEGAGAGARAAGGVGSASEVIPGQISIEQMTGARAGTGVAEGAGAGARAGVAEGAGAGARGLAEAAAGAGAAGAGAAEGVGAGLSGMGKLMKGFKGVKAIPVIGTVLGLVASGYDIATAKDKKRAVATNAGSWAGAGAGASAGALAGAAIGSVIPIVGTAVGAVAGSIIGGVAGAIGGEKATAEIYDNFDSIKAGAQKTWDDWDKGVVSVWESTKSAFSTAGGWLSDSFDNISKGASTTWDDWSKGVVNASDSVSNFLGGIPGMLAGAGTSISSWFSDIGKGIGDTLKAGLKSAGELASDIGKGVSKTASDVGTGISNAASTAGNWVSDVGSSIWGGIKSIWAGGNDNVPYDSYPALLHKGEMVLPAPKANWLRTSMGANAVPTTSVTGSKNSSNSFVSGLPSYAGGLDYVGASIPNPVPGAKIENSWGNERSKAATGGTGQHQGIDIFSSNGTPIKAAYPGTVSNSGWNTIGGWRVGITDDSQTYWYYAHMNEDPSQMTPLNSRVSVGQVIGNVGSSGDAKGTPPHLHFGIEPGYGQGGTWVNPFPYLSGAVDSMLGSLVAGGASGVAGGVTQSAELTNMNNMLNNANKAVSENITIKARDYYMRQWANGLIDMDQVGTGIASAIATGSYPGMNGTSSAPGVNGASGDSGYTGVSSYGASGNSGSSSMLGSLLASGAGVNPNRNEMMDYINNVASKKGVPSDIALATAWTESEMTQFKNGQVYKDNDDYGLMQINHKSWSDTYDWNRVSNDWKYNVDSGMTILSDRYRKAVSMGLDPARGAYSGYNTYSNLDRYATENDSRDTNFFRNYQGAPWRALAWGDKITEPTNAIIGEDAPQYPEYAIPTNPAYKNRAVDLLKSAANDIGVSTSELAGGGMNIHVNSDNTQVVSELQAVVGRLDELIDVMTKSLSPMKVAFAPQRVASTDSTNIRNFI